MSALVLVFIAQQHCTVTVNNALWTIQCNGYGVGKGRKSSSRSPAPPCPPETHACATGTSRSHSLSMSASNCSNVSDTFFSPQFRGAFPPWTVRWFRFPGTAPPSNLNMQPHLPTLPTLQGLSSCDLEVLVRVSAWCLPKLLNGHFPAEPLRLDYSQAWAGENGGNEICECVCL